ncbi:MAG: hypothetical protein IJM15_09510, partial [Erysipelotrichaceae bacterium]|nr:hypothetical protein [Erysipelotrichaceae bacterium]
MNKKTQLLLSELKRYGISESDAELIATKEGITLAKVPYGNTGAFLKCYEDPAYRREIKNYEILQSLDIPTIKVMGKSECSLLLEDVESSERYRLGIEPDFTNPNVIIALAKWYKTLHTNGSGYVLKHGEGMYEEWDCLTLENIRSIKEHFSLEDSQGLKMFEENFPFIREMLDKAPTTLTYNDFYYTNMIVSKDESEALMFDYDLLGKGCYVSDLRNVLYWFSEEDRKLFFSVYGQPDKKLFLLDEICSPIVSLYSAMERNIFPDWAKEA